MDTPRTSSKSPERDSVFTSQCVIKVSVDLIVKDSSTVEVEHIDNPKGYGDGNDPREVDPRLRPVCAAVGFAILEPLTADYPLLLQPILVSPPPRKLQHVSNAFR